MTRKLVLGALTAAAVLALTAGAASAADGSPCGGQVRQSWSPEPVQQCPLTAPLSNGWVPVYAQPVAHAAGAPVPGPAGWLHGTSGQYFVCQQQFGGAEYVHPRGWRNNWWARTKSDDGVSGWTPEVFFSGGNNDEADGGLRACGGGGQEPSGPVGGGLPPLGGGHSGPVDAYRYDYAHGCTTGPSAGAKALLAWLKKNFQGSSDGIYNCRKVRGSTKSFSLHAEGRAVDYHENAGTRAGKAIGDKIVATLLARDRAGNANALARRMGVQEIIWNRHIWTADHAKQGMQPYDGVDPHTSHVHIGLNWPGARLQTSFWRG
jgi:hypothetical protein